MATSITTARDMAHRIWHLLEGNAVREAVALCQQLNREHPDYAEGWHVASHAAERASLAGRALEFIGRALQLEPGNSGFQMQQATLFHRHGRLEEGLDIARQLVGSRQNSAAAYNLLGATLSRFDLHEDALQAFDSAIGLAGERDHYQFNRTAELRFLGRLAEAEQAADRCIALNPHHYEAYMLRSDLRRQDDANNHTAQLRALIPRARDWRGKSQLCFALAKELEDLSDYSGSFGYRAEGADLRRQHMVYHPQTDLQAMATIRRVFDARVFSNIASECRDQSPVFILGLPRTGTTLLERILDGHSQVHSAGELNDFAQQLVRLARTKFGAGAERDQFVEQSAQIDFGELGAAYIRSTSPVAGSAPRFIDKLPLNYLYAGLIHLALPNAHIIHMRRHPMAACYAVYKQLFRDAYPFSYSLQELGDYYVAYHQLMAHWQRLIPASAMSDVYYEDLVTQTEDEARRVLDFIGLSWENQCLQFHKQKSASTTASAAQVREPAHTRSVDQWRNYQTQLQPLMDILVAGGVTGLE